MPRKPLGQLLLLFANSSISKSPQKIRYELLSVILVRSKSVWDWLVKNIEKDNLYIALMAVFGHHLKVKEASYFEINSDSLEIYTKTDDFQKILKLGCRYFGLSAQLPSLTGKFKEGELKKAGYCLGGDTNSCFVKLDNSCQGDLDKLKKIAVVKAMVMAADLAASALLENERGNRSYTDWIADALNQVMTVEGLQ